MFNILIKRNCIEIALHRVYVVGNLTLQQAFKQED